VQSLLKDRNLTLLERGVEMSVDIPFTRIRCWERGLTQVLANLVDNAIKYSRDAKPPRIRITGEELPQVLRFSVADNGIGFDMQYHDRIFGLFNRLVRAEDFEGTGAGLAIVHRLVEKQDGRIWAQSAPGEGATFFVELPKQ
jgi:light-regulated signal transduction histidine kinase (bacteriophytochrome)